MVLYTRAGGIYQTVATPYVRVNGVYAIAKQAYVKSGTGTTPVWNSSFLYDVIPPDPPEVTLQLIETWNDKNVLTGRYIKVGVRLPGTANDADLRLIRVLTNFPRSSETPPTTQFGGEYWETSDSDWKSEPWSEWRYNKYGDHGDSSVLNYKQWPPNATTSTDITNDKHFHFTAWALDDQGNWSVPTHAMIYVPKATVNAPKTIVKEASFQANTSGSWQAAGFVSGTLTQRDSPRSRGLWFYGNQFVDSIGSNSTDVTIRSAQIFIKREDDSGNANADIHLGWTPYGTVGALPAPGSGITTNDIHKLGTLAKGQGDWFTVPVSFYNDWISKSIKGLELNYKDYNRATAYPEDRSDIQKVADNMRCGEVHMVWEEHL